MEPPPTGQETVGHDESPVHAWRVSPRAPGRARAAGRDLRRLHRLASDRPAGAARLPPRARPPDCRLISAARTPAMTARATWRDDAACRHADPDLFFPIGATEPVLRQISEAKRICRACPARTAGPTPWMRPL
jgi:hypothetical protein